MALPNDEKILLIKFRAKIKAKGMNLKGFHKLYLESKKITYTNFAVNINGYRPQLHKTIKAEIEKFLKED